MFKPSYFKYLLKSNLKLWGIFTGILCALIAVIMAIFDPKTIAQINNSSGNLPFNPLGDISSLLAFISNQYFGMFALILPMIYLVLLALKMLAGQVEKGSMASHLSTPTSRTQITGTSALFLLSSLAVMYGLIAGVGIAAAEIVQPGHLDIGIYLQLTLGSFLLLFAIGSITFLASAIWNQTGKAMLIGAGIPVFFFLAKLLSGMSSKLENLKYATLTTLFDTKAIMDGKDFLAQFVLLGAVGIVLILSGMIVFRKKDLPI